MADEAKLLEIVTKYATNPEWGHLILKKMATALLELDEYEDGEVLTEEDFTKLNEFAEVF